MKSSQNKIDIFNQTWNRYKKDVYIYSFSLLNNKNDAEDCLQYSFQKYYEALVKNINIESPKKWLLKVTNRQAKKIWQQRKIINLLCITKINEQGYDYYTAFYEVEEKERFQTIMNCINKKLSKKDIEYLKLLKKRTSVEELSNIYKISYSGIYSKTNRLKKRIINIISKVE